MKQVLLSLSAVVLLVSAGCSSEESETYPVHGIVQFRDGKLLQEGVVEFEVTNRKKPVIARAEIGPDGTFSLGTFAPADGAVVGTHRIAVIADHRIGSGAERPEMLGTAKLDPKFRQFRRSGLTYTVRPGINEVIIKVRYAPPDPKTEAGEARKMTVRSPQ